MATSTHVARARAAPTVAHLREMMAEAVDRLIAAMDALDAPDEDMEPSLSGSQCIGYAVDAESDHPGGMADDEPTLGAPERHVPRKGQDAWADGGADDLEINGDENEPSLGGIAMSEHRSQECWSEGCNDDTEEEHDGREPDQDAEPELGSTTCVDQRHAWAIGSKCWLVMDGEPSLGWTGHGHGHPETAMRGYDDDREATTGPRDEEWCASELGIADAGGLQEAWHGADGPGEFYGSGCAEVSAPADPWPMRPA